METLTSKTALRAWLKTARTAQKTVGLVPTMGFLHEGHLSLVEQARNHNDVVVVSIFVNPTQFGPGEDLDAYPRDLARDQKLLEAAGVDVIFAPTPEEMYPGSPHTFVNVYGALTQGLCGASRPGHFQGVATVVSKLFNLVQPDNAYFGQKDAQQLAVLKCMVKELDFPINIVGCPIVRESDGLAMSSRNTYLSAQERQDALVLHQSLQLAEQLVTQGQYDAQQLILAMRSHIESVNSAQVDYISIVDADTLEPVNVLSGSILIALAVRIGKTRLIDNTMLVVKAVAEVQ